MDGWDGWVRPRPAGDNLIFKYSFDYLLICSAGGRPLVLSRVLMEMSVKESFNGFEDRCLQYDIIGYGRMVMQSSLLIFGTVGRRRWHVEQTVAGMARDVKSCAWPQQGETSQVRIGFVHRTLSLSLSLSLSLVLIISSFMHDGQEVSVMEVSL
jgi:hypothetical protein